ncbi:ACT domain-containing protein [Aeromicrobium sp. CTD01-1L150]|uniref:ACT domain-containing protein n=1 Tax=Aeromicrobium sp. CTD01-1L150 TaxID=3341830 RepID=UPI0035BF2694
MTSDTDPATASVEPPRGELGLRMLEGPVVYAIVNPGYDATGALATIGEDEGITVIVEQDVADDDGLVYEFVGAWITLEEPTALDSVGITAQLSSRLADAGIACNVIAGFHHDHLVVPWEQRHSAMEALRALG